MKHFYFLLIALFSFQFSQAQIVNIPDANFKNALVNTNCVDIDGDGSGGDVDADTNDDGEIQVSEALAVSNLWISNQSISSIEGIQSFTNLQTLECQNNQITSLDLLSVNTNLERLYCSSNNLTTLDLSSNFNLNNVLIDANNNLTSVNLSNTSIISLTPGFLFSLTDLNLSNCSSLETIEFFDIPVLSTLNVTNCTSLTTLNTSADDISSTSLSSIDLSTCLSLNELIIQYSLLESLDLSNNINLTNLYIPYNSSLSELNISNTQLSNFPSNLSQTYTEGTPLVDIIAQNCNNLINVSVSNISNPQLENLDLQQCDNLNSVSVTNGVLKNLFVSNCGSLNTIYVPNNDLIGLDIDTCLNLNALDISGNQFTSINVTQNSNLQDLFFNNNNISEIDISQNSNLQNLLFNNNTISEIDVSQNILLEMLACDYNQLSTLDMSNNQNLQHLDCTNNQLTTLFVKNGSQEVINNFSNNPNLIYICADELDFPDINLLIDTNGYTDCVVNSYCNFVPGGEFFTIEGQNIFDSDSNGCNVNDGSFPNLKFNISNGTTNGIIISNDSGNFNIPVQAESHSITPELENPEYFTVSPSNITVNFPTDASPFVQDFCIAPNGVHNDLEIIILPLEQARPGFDANYKIIYKNKGNTIISDTVEFLFNSDFMEFVSSNPIVNNQLTGELNWDFSNLLPFETREIYLTMNLNTPTDDNFPLNGGDNLDFVANIFPITGDETTSDNSFQLNQEVVNSFDPNDKNCLEGDTIEPEQVGKYMHYMIRFENTGTAEAVNIVVKDVIDETKFDVSTLIPMDSSHNFVTRIQNTNEVEFIFENINLPFDDANNDGYVVFKIQTLPTLVVGDTFENDAEIYFDYNFPITTNNEQTTVQENLGVGEYDSLNVSMYPNPVNDILNIETQETIKSIEVYNINGSLLHKIVNIGIRLQNQINLKYLQAGIYFVKINTDKGKKTYKIVKN